MFQIYCKTHKKQTKKGEKKIIYRGNHRKTRTRDTLIKYKEDFEESKTLKNTNKTIS